MDWLIMVSGFDSRGGSLIYGKESGHVSESDLWKTEYGSDR